MPRYSGLSRSAHERGTGLPSSASRFTKKPTVPEWIVVHMPFGSFMAAGT